jgi:hypothetical protein
MEPAQRSEEAIVSRPVLPAVVLVAVSVGAGVLIGRQSVDPIVAGDATSRIAALEADGRDFDRRLRAAREEAERWRERAAGTSRELRAEVPETVAARPAVARTAAVVRAEIRDALARGDGNALLGLLSELAALGDEHLGDVVATWSRLVAMDAAQLDALGLSRLALTAALLREAGLVRFGLEQADLDPSFRQFAAATLQQAALGFRRTILATLDVAEERDKAVLIPLLRAARELRDPAYVDRFLHCVQRTDLYNDTRSSVAFMIAEIGGAESRRALDVLRATGDYQRIATVLEHIYAPPATGLLVTDGFSPTPERIALSDIILEYDGHAIATQADLVRADSGTRPGDVVVVKVLRGGVERRLLVTVTDSAPGHLHFSSRAIVKRPD